MTEGSSTLNGYFNDVLDSHNSFNNNVIHSCWNGDAIFFSLQNYSTCSDNIVQGCRLAIYMCKNSIISGNIIYTSISSGIMISLPSHNVTFSSNFIMNAYESSIVVRKQMEHGDFTSSNYNINILNNEIIKSGFHGIDLNDVDLAVVASNKIDEVAEHGIYILNGTNIVISSNLIITSNKSIYIDIGSTNNIVDSNKTYNVFPNYTESAVYTLYSFGNTISNNNFYGTYTSVLINQIPDNLNNVLINNRHFNCNNILICP